MFKKFYFLLFFNLIIISTLIAQEKIQPKTQTPLAVEAWTKYSEKTIKCETEFCVSKPNGPFKTLLDACETSLKKQIAEKETISTICKETLNTQSKFTYHETERGDFKSEQHLSKGLWIKENNTDQAIQELALLNTNQSTSILLLLKTKQGWFISREIGKSNIGGAMGVEGDLIIPLIQFINLNADQSYELLLEAEIYISDTDMGLNGEGNYNTHYVIICSAIQNIPYCTPRLPKLYSYDYTRLLKQEHWDKKLESHKKTDLFFNYNSKNGTFKATLKAGAVPKILLNWMEKEIPLHDMLVK